MKFFELSTRTLNLHATSWCVDNPIGHIILIHGLGEYAERFDTTARFYNSCNFNVYAFDLPGHGKTEGLRGDIGERRHIYHAIDCLIDYAMDFGESLPFCMHGHSLGGNICLSYRLARQNPLIKAYILSAPWLQLASHTGAIRVGITKILGSATPRILTHLQAINLLKQISRGEVGEDYIRDNLIHSQITAKTAIDAITCGHNVMRTARKLKSPVIIFHGELDNICSHDASSQFIKKSSAKSLFISLPNTGHENMHLPIYIETMTKVVNHLSNL